MDKEELINRISSLIQNQIELQKGYLDLLEESFAFIKYQNITRESQIERLLDEVLNMFQTEEVRELYTRICLYYHAINRETAKDYANIYLELYEDDSILKKIEEIEMEMKSYGKSKSIFHKRNK